MAVKILTDSTSYIPEDIREKLNIGVVSLYLSFGNDSVKEIEVANEDFYNKMDAQGIPTSSQPGAGEIYERMLETVERGDSLCCIFISSQMSGTLNTAEMMKEKVLQKYEQAKIEIVDSKSNSMQLGFAVIQAALAAQMGKSLEEVKKTALENTKRSRFLFIPESLEYLKKGGRIGGASALLGTLLNIKPILTVENGKTAIFKKVKSKKKAVMVMLEKMLQDINLHGLGEIVIHHINCMDEARELIKLITKTLNVNIKIMDIGPVIGLHVGPGTIGVVYYTQEELR